MQALRSSDAAPAACPAQQGTDDRPEEAGQVWIFGFGSLVYRPGVHIELTLAAVVLNSLLGFGRCASF